MRDKEVAKKLEIAEVAKMLEKLTPIQVDVVHSIIQSFSEEQQSERTLPDFLTEEAFEYFSMRLAAHHAYSSTVLKKENFEHILESAFRRSGVPAERTSSMTARGADLRVNGTALSLKTEAAKNLDPQFITISKLMEAVWIKRITSVNDIPEFIRSMVVPHFANYDRIFILRAYNNPRIAEHIKYELREIPKHLLLEVQNLQPKDFSPLTATRTTSAEVRTQGMRAYKFRLDGSDDKLTINNLSVRFCPLHAWWSLAKPT